MLKKLIKHSLILSLFLITNLLLISTPSFAVIEVMEFESPAQEQRYRSLIAELRCLKCQNQNLASSDAPLAKDLRTIASDMIKSGSNDEDIKTFMTERYGDFVLYKPPFNLATAFLWLGPIFLLLIIIVSIITSVKKRQNNEYFTTNSVNDDSDRAQVRNLLRDTPTLDNHQDSDGAK